MLLPRTPGALSATFALLAALLWGAGDFSGGMGVKAAGGSVRDALRVILAAHAMSLIVLLAVLGARHAAWPSTAPLLWGLTGGVAGALGLLAFYIALSKGAMGASAAISGLLAAAIPAAVSSFLEGAPTPLRLGGFLLASVAIWLIAAAPTPNEHVPALSDPVLASNETTQTSSIAARRRLLLLAVGGGIGFGFYFVGLRFANAAGVVEPMAMARVASLLTCLLLLFVLRPDASATSQGSAGAGRWLGRQAFFWAIGVAVLDTGGNLFYVAATRTGRLDAAAVLASLYPAPTILLAALLLRERLARTQVVGMVLAMIAVVLITR